jgi:hypothetical protein
LCGALPRPVSSRRRRRGHLDRELADEALHAAGGVFDRDPGDRGDVAHRRVVEGLAGHRRERLLAVSRSELTTSGRD